jgi:hypothetical protein
MTPDDRARLEATVLAEAAQEGAIAPIARAAPAYRGARIRIPDFGGVTFAADGSAFVEAVVEIPAAIMGLPDGEREKHAAPEPVVDGPSPASRIPVPAAYAPRCPCTARGAHPGIRCRDPLRFDPLADSWLCAACGCAWSTDHLLRLLRASEPLRANPFGAFAAAMIEALANAERRRP